MSISRDQLRQSALRDQRDLSNRIKLMLPVQPTSQKYFCSHLAQITSLSAAIPAHTEGRFAIVTNVGLGCDGRERRQRRERLAADGEVVWS